MTPPCPSGPDPKRQGPRPIVCYEREVQITDRPFAPFVLGAIAAGGAIGATGRWAVAELLDTAGTPHVAGTWPWATLVVNVIGCVLIGLAARTLSAGTVAWAFAVTGVLGGFTTFSAFANESVNLMRQAEAAMTIVNVLANVLLCLAAVWAGRSIAFALWR